MIYSIIFKKNNYYIGLLFDNKGRLLANGIPLTNLCESKRTFMRVVNKHVKMETITQLVPTPSLKEKAKIIAKFLVMLSLGKTKPHSVRLLQEFSLSNHPWLTKKEAQVIEYLLCIPSGKVASYKQIAKAVGLSPRTVAKIMAKNPYPIIYPCHRIIYANGNLGGYLGSKEFTNIKKALLLREGIEIKDNKVHKKYFISFL